MAHPHCRIHRWKHLITRYDSTRGHAPWYRRWRCQQCAEVLVIRCWEPPEDARRYVDLADLVKTTRKRLKNDKSYLACISPDLSST